MYIHDKLTKELATYADTYERYCKVMDIQDCAEEVASPSARFSFYAEWLDYKTQEFFGKPIEKLSFEEIEFCISYIKKLNALTNSALLKHERFGIDVDGWFYEMEDHAEKTKGNH